MLLEDLSQNGDGSRSSLDRVEVEGLCILAAIPKSGSSIEALLPRLGLSPLLCSAVEKAIDRLVDMGQVENHEGQIALTATGEALLNDWSSRVGGLDDDRP